MKVVDKNDNIYFWENAKEKEGAMEDVLEGRYLEAPIWPKWKAVSKRHAHPIHPSICIAV